MDTKPEHAKAQPENSIILPKWEGAVGDKDLVSYIPFLEYIATMGITDVRTALEGFQGKHIPTEFARREALARAEFEKQLADDRAKRPRRSAPGLVASMLGMKPAGVDGEYTAAEGFERGKMIQDQARERGQKQYEALQKELKENGEKWLAEMKAEESKAQEEAMKGMRTSLGSIFGGGK
jgi:mitochondrial import inner membrane translocase subunit TIM50